MQKFMPGQKGRLHKVNCMLKLFFIQGNWLNKQENKKKREL